jgi:hypothetical protein
MAQQLQLHQQEGSYTNSGLPLVRCELTAPPGTNSAVPDSQVSTCMCVGVYVCCGR